MGLPPSEVKALTLWEFSACVAGWNKSQGKSHSVEGDPMSDDDYEKLCELGDMWNG